MGRTIQPEAFEVFTLDELTPEARLKAIANVTSLMAGDWWDEGDVEQVSKAIVYAFAEALMSPGWNRYDEGDFPGIDGVQLGGWDLDRADTVALDGTLTRQNAPALPWLDGIVEVRLEVAPRGGHTYIGVVVEHGETSLARGAVMLMRNAVTDAMFAAKSAGRRQLEWLTSNERAEDDILANGREFTADGELYTG